MDRGEAGARVVLAHVDGAVGTALEGVGRLTLALGEGGRWVRGRRVPVAIGQGGDDEAQEAECCRSREARGSQQHLHDETLYSQGQQQQQKHIRRRRAKTIFYLSFLPVSALPPHATSSRLHIVSDSVCRSISGPTNDVERRCAVVKIHETDDVFPPTRSKMKGPPHLQISRPPHLSPQGVPRTYCMGSPPHFALGGGSTGGGDSELLECTLHFRDQRQGKVNGNINGNWGRRTPILAAYADMASSIPIDGTFLSLYLAHTMNHVLYYCMYK